MRFAEKRHKLHLYEMTQLQLLQFCLLPYHSLAGLNSQHCLLLTIPSRWIYGNFVQTKPELAWCGSGLWPYRLQHEFKQDHFRLYGHKGHVTGHTVIFVCRESQTRAARVKLVSCMTTMRMNQCNGPQTHLDGHVALISAIAVSTGRTT